MEILLAILKFAFLTLGIIYSYSNTAKLIYKNNVSSWQAFFMGAGIAGFIVLQFCL